jgi:hypothetical protein
MIYWIKKFARITGFLCFFMVFFLTLNPAAPFELESIVMALLKAAGAAALFWFIGYIVGDMVFKGIVEEAGVGEVDEIDGGILQRIRQSRQQQSVQQPAVTAQAQEPAKGLTRK